MKANSTAGAGDRLTESEIYGQVKWVLLPNFLPQLCSNVYASLLLFAGQDTTSHALSRILNQLAHFTEAQRKLREEIREAKEARGGEDFDYDTLMGLSYLDAICRETLRLFPPVADLDRT